MCKLGIYAESSVAIPLGPDAGRRDASGRDNSGSLAPRRQHLARKPHTCLEMNRALRKRQQAIFKHAEGLNFKIASLDGRINTNPVFAHSSVMRIHFCHDWPPAARVGKSFPIRILPNAQTRWQTRLPPSRKIATHRPMFQR
jgi:hypothetical protein